MNLIVDDNYRARGAVAGAEARAQDHINFVAETARGEKLLAQFDIFLVAARKTRTAHADRNCRPTHNRLR